MLKWRYNLADGETFPVKVFKDHPEWDRCERWFNMRLELLRELHVATYDVDNPRQLDWLEKQYPGHVFVY